jgi:hypothetical protein
MNCNILSISNISNINIHLLETESKIKGLNGAERCERVPRMWTPPQAPEINLPKASNQVIVCNIFSILSISNINIRFLDTGFKRQGLFWRSEVRRWNMGR